MIGDQIRLIDLLPRLDGTESSLIRCKSRVVSLSDKPQYEAVSYVWGDPSDAKVPIEVEGKPFGISKNLHAALLRFRLPDTIRSLWVDQVSIHQWDLDEKCSQVRLMREIYTGCSCCLAWLGEIPQDIPHSDAEAVLELLEYMSSVRGVKHTDQVPVPPFMANLETFEGPIKALQFITMKQNHWWERIWTVQEAVLPPTFCLVWGHIRITWETLVAAAATWTTNTPRALQLVLTEFNIEIISTILAQIVWFRIDKTSVVDPLDISMKWRFRKASDPRDKIYALLGLRSTIEMPTMKRCDYTDLYVSHTVDLIVAKRSLLPLVVDPRLVEPDKPTPSLPRWAFDIKDVPFLAEIWYTKYGHGAYKASRGRSLDLQAITTRQSKMVLPVTGVYVDKVKIVKKLLHGPTKELSDEMLVETLQDWEEAVLENEGAKPGTPSIKSSAVSETFVRVIIGDLVRNHEDWVTGSPTVEHIQRVVEFVHTGKQLPHGVRQTIWRMILDTSLFITETGGIGLGCRDSAPDDEVWILYGSNMPFTLRRIEGDDGTNDVDRDFVGKCYVQGIMFGEIFINGSARVEEKQIRLH